MITRGPESSAACLILGVGVAMEKQVIGILEAVLTLNGRGAAFQRQTPLLGELPELDSMAVLSVITALEEHFGFEIHDDEIDGATFATVGALVDFVTAKLVSQ